MDDQDVTSIKSPVESEACHPAFNTPLGAHIVGLSFNPSGNEDVNFIKGVTAQVIDYVTAAGKDPRCTQLAIDNFETAAMYAVKSVTKQPRT